jgi:hypothetical protein
MLSVIIPKVMAPSIEPLNDLAPERNKLYCRLSINLC